MSKGYNPTWVNRHRNRIRVYVAQKRTEAVCGCGSKDRIHFHHVKEDGTQKTKLSAAASSLWSLARIDAELAKCIPLCHSCHMEEHARTRWKSGFRPKRIRTATQERLQHEFAQ